MKYFLGYISLLKCLARRARAIRPIIVCCWSVSLQINFLSREKEYLERLEERSFLLFRLNFQDIKRTSKTPLKRILCTKNNYNARNLIIYNINIAKWFFLEE